MGGSPPTDRPSLKLPTTLTVVSSQQGFFFYFPRMQSLKKGVQKKKNIEENEHLFHLMRLSMR